MHHPFKKQILSIIFLLLSFSCYLQNNEIKIKFIGNCGFYMTDGVSDIYFDFPYKSGAFGYMEFDEAELDSINEKAIFIFTHKHADHYSKKNLKKVTKRKDKQSFGVWNIEELERLGEKIKDFEIKAFKTKHTFFGIPFRHYSFLITWHGKRIYISGDTTEPETIGEMKNIDLAFVPYWILSNAMEKGIAVDAKKIAVYHLHPKQIPSAKESLAGSDKYIPMTSQGEKLSIVF